MQSRRDYLVSLGLAKPGRGKFSTAGKAALVEAEAKGIKFSDNASPVKPVNPTIVKADAPVKNDPTLTQYLTPSEYRYPEAEYRAFTREDGKRKEVTLRWACNTCKVSLVNHMCESPTILNFVPVTIEKR